jgi:hypothetical protein
LARPREAASRHPRHRPRSGGRGGPRGRPATSLSCSEPPPASLHSRRSVCAGRGRRDILHPGRATEHT